MVADGQECSDVLEACGAALPLAKLLGSCAASRPRTAATAAWALSSLARWTPRAVRLWVHPPL